MQLFGLRTLLFLDTVCNYDQLFRDTLATPGYSDLKFEIRVWHCIGPDQTETVLGTSS